MTAAATTGFPENPPVWLPPLLSGLLLGIAFPTYPSVHGEMLAWIALSPLLLSLEHEKRFVFLFRNVFLTMLLFCLISLWWVGIATLPGGILTVIAQSFFLTIPLLIFFVFRQRGGYRFALFSLPFVWTGWEWAYMQQDLSLGWLTLGNTQANLVRMVQYADLTGVWGVSFWLLWFNVLTVLMVKERGNVRKTAVIAFVLALMIAAPLVYSASVFSREEQQNAGPTVKVAIVQPNIDPYDKWKSLDPAETMRLYFRMTGNAVALERPDLVLWPETALPFYILDQQYDGYMISLRHLLAQWNVSLLTGFSDIVFQPPTLASRERGNMRFDQATRKYYETYNASMLLDPEGGAPQIYHKIRLVPFAERVPYMDYFPWLERFTFSLAGIRSWGRGADTTIMQFRNSKGVQVKTANIICYESIFPGLVAQFVRKGAQFLTLVTNDGWYATSYGPYQHAAIGRLRCIENRRSMARCANTGITLFYDRYGRSYAEIPWWERRTLTADISLNSELSWYTRFPDLLPRLSVIVSLCLACYAAFRKTV
jgi:apolipoprotein N-acyltransferase